MAACLESPPAEAPARRPRLAFLGVGWIGAHRLQAIASRGLAEIVAIADANASAAWKAREQIELWSPHARVESVERALDEDIDGVVIATPNSEHAPQSRAALSRGRAVFCQKPLARTLSEALEVVEAARSADRFIDVDFCYRRVAGVEQMKTLVNEGALGEVFAVELVFHNAYGPDKPWFYDVNSAGGGCVIDLGIHLIDLLLWTLGYPRVEHVSSKLYRGGNPLPWPIDGVEDYALAELHLSSHITARMACSWRLSAGCDAVIEASFFGTRGSVRLRNVNGSFYDFQVEHCEGTRTRALAVPANTWGAVPICEWARQLAQGAHFRREAEQLTEVHRVLDAIYGR